MGYALLVAGGLSLAACRRAPVTVLAVTGLCALGHQAVGLEAPAVPYLVAVYAAVRAGHRIVTVAASVIMLVALPLVLLAAPHGWTGGEAVTQARDVLPLAWLIAAGAAGEALRQAERRADEAERTREETARRRADEERLHIARELHDSLTHQISVKCRPRLLSTWPAGAVNRCRKGVDDDGTATPDVAPVPGVGLLGMGERVTALGGHLKAAPRSGGGFTVHADLPVDHTP